MRFHIREESNDVDTFGKPIGVRTTLGSANGPVPVRMARPAKDKGLDVSILGADADGRVPGTIPISTTADFLGLSTEYVDVLLQHKYLNRHADEVTASSLKRLLETHAYPGKNGLCYTSEVSRVLGMSED